jgi:hypothetical protein
VHWKTDELSTSAVTFGKTTALELGTLTDATMVESHQVLLTGLTADTTYHFTVTSVDAKNNEAKKGGFTFKTSTVPDNTPPNISAIKVFTDHDMALVTWTTDELASSRVDYGLTAIYQQHVTGGTFTTVHQLLLTGLKADTTYHFSVTSADPHKNSRSSIDTTFRTKGEPDTTPPVISNIVVVAENDKATVTWTTNEPANSRVDYGETTAYASGPQSSANYVTSHKIELTRLKADTTYHFKVTSADASANSASSEDQTFKTKGAPDTTPPVISNVSVLVMHDSATVTWTTNEPANSRVDYGLTNNYTDNRVLTTRVTSHQVQLTGLTATTLYHFKVTSVDAANNSASSGDDTFLTRDKPKAGSKSEISQFGITWTFDKAYPAGQFANGDWWVVGPVKVVKIDPPSNSGSRVMNGSMINPSPTLVQKQGYDSTMKDNVYVGSLNVALDVSSSKPLTIPAHSSLVSTISVTEARHRPQLKGCSVLTVLPSAAGPGDFRPSYSGKSKAIKFNSSQLNYSLLKRLKATDKTPSLASVERMFERPWLDHSGKWTGREYHPEDNMESYGRGLSTHVGIGALMLHLDFSNEQKAKLMTGFVQVGIDLSGIVDDGGDRNWHNNGGHASGRKWPILFAGLVLNDSHMKGIGSRSVWFGEDMQTFYVLETSPGVYNNGFGNYKSSHKGMPEYGIRHSTDQKRDDVNWASSYRQCCTANSWLGFVLAARIMNAKSLWNHPALFDYQDRYIPQSRKNNEPSWIQSWHRWPLVMWDVYRSNY